jgi:hypothetical protein
MRWTALQQNVLRCAGLTIGPLAWAINTQLGQILPYLECRTRLPLLAGASIALALLSLAAGYLSGYPLWRCESSGGEPPNDAETPGFVAALSALTGALFAFPLLLQAVSSLVLTGCER